MVFSRKVSGRLDISMVYVFLSNLFPAIPSSTAFYKGIYFIKHCVIVTSNNYYVIDSHFIKSSILKPIIES